MMLVFFFGIGVSSILVALTRTPWQLAAALALVGAFAAIYHPVGIPMLVQGADRPGRVIGVNGLAGNLGIAAAALLTGFLHSGGVFQPQIGGGNTGGREPRRSDLRHLGVDHELVGHRAR
jgi:MFS family permease